MSRRGGGVGCFGVAFALAALTGMVVLAPNVAVVLLVVFFTLRKLVPDRLVAGVVVVLWSPPALLLLAMPDDLRPEWWWPVVLWPSMFVYSHDPQAWVLTGLVLGPVLGASLWRVSQWSRERSPHSGRDERELRMRQEERRRRWTVQTAHRLRWTSSSAVVRRLAAVFTVPLGDAGGPFLGRWQRGDLGDSVSRPWRAGPTLADGWPRPLRWLAVRLWGRRVRLPVDVVPHAVVLGATGAGKSETICSVAEWGLAHGWRVIYLSMKEPSRADDAVAPRLARVASALGHSTAVLERRARPFDPLRGGREQILDRFLRAEVFSDDYYRRTAAEVLSLILDARAARGLPVRSVRDVLDVGSLTSLCAGDRVLTARLKALDPQSVRGASARYAGLGNLLDGWAGEGFSWEDADLVAAELPTGSQPEAASALLRLMLRDFDAWMRDPARRDSRRVLLIMEEAGQVAADPVVGHDLVGLVERGRSAGVTSIVSAQDPLGLGDERTRSALLSNGALITFAQPMQAEYVAQVAGEFSAEVGSVRFGYQGLGDGGTTQRQTVGKVSPQLVRSLDRGELLVAHRGRYALAAAGRAASSYVLPDATPASLPVAEPLALSWPAPVAAPLWEPPASLPRSVPEVGYGPAPRFSEEPPPAGLPDFAPAPTWQRLS